jgi:hypothetical protein
MWMMPMSINHKIERKKTQDARWMALIFEWHEFNIIYLL